MAQRYNSEERTCPVNDKQKYMRKKSYVNFLLPSSSNALNLKKQGEIHGFPNFVRLDWGRSKADQVFGQ